MHTRDLEVFKKAYALVLRVYELTDKYPSDERFRVVDQMCRASTSICANLVEGLEKYASLAEQKRFLTMAKGSSEEMHLWCMISRDRKYISLETFHELAQGYEEVNRMLYGLMERRSKLASSLHQDNSDKFNTNFKGE